MEGNPIPAAGFFLYRSTASGPRWLLLRNRKRQDWGFPKGHGEQGESLEETARRECAEETGIQDCTLRSEAHSITYPVRRGLKSVTYFLAETESETVTLSKEHDDCCWVDAEQAQQLLAHENTRTLFAEAIAGLPC